MAVMPQAFAPQRVNPSSLESKLRGSKRHHEPGGHYGAYRHASFVCPSELSYALLISTAELAPKFVARAIQRKCGTGRTEKQLSYFDYA